MDGSPVQQKEEKSENGKNQYARIFLLLSTSKLVFRLLLRRRSFLCALVSRYVCAPVRVFFMGVSSFRVRVKVRKDFCGSCCSLSAKRTILYVRTRAHPGALGKG